MNLSESERQELESLQRKRTAPVAQVRRAKLIQAQAEGRLDPSINEEIAEGPFSEALIAGTQLELLPHSARRNASVYPGKR